jgi:hypothetical protein
MNRSRLADHIGVAAALMLLATVAACSSTQAPSQRTGAISARPGTASPTSAPSPSASATGEGPGCAASGSAAVSTTAQLQNALATAHPGETIMLSPGVYRGGFVARGSGSPGAPITLCGGRAAVLEGNSLHSGYVFYLDRASWWRLEGFTVEGGQKGVVADGVSHDVIDGLYVHTIGDEAIHLRAFSSDNVVTRCTIRRTGLLKPKFGEGIYVGSAHKNWCRYSGCRPDASNHNVLSDNNIADTTAENIDIKEGTTAGRIIGNHLDGTGMVSSAATAWINVKGNNWSVDGNTGINSIRDGFQVHQVYPGWGIGNVFLRNHATVNGPGYGIYVQHSELQAVVACDNVVTGAGSGSSSITCSNA